MSRRRGLPPSCSLRLDHSAQYSRQLWAKGTALGADLGQTVLKEREAALTVGAKEPGSESVWLSSPRDRLPLR